MSRSVIYTRGADKNNNKIELDPNLKSFGCYVSYLKREWTSDFTLLRLLTSDFSLHTSEFRLRTSDFSLYTLDLRLQTSDFRLWNYDFRFQSQHLRFVCHVVVSAVSGSKPSPSNHHGISHQLNTFNCC